MNRMHLLAIAFLLCVSNGCASQKGEISKTLRSAYQQSLESLTSSGMENASVPRTEIARDRNLRAVAYNVHLLPGVAMPFAGKRSASAYRARKIAEQLLPYDLIGLCEAFDTTHSQTLTDALQSQSADNYYVARGPSRSGRHAIGSGLLLLSKYPILEAHTTTYRNASRILTHGLKADGFAAKGALHVRILVDQQSGSTLDCFLTHLESQSPGVRKLQVLEFSSFVAEHQNTHNPVLLLGDFNIAFEQHMDLNPDSEYKHLVENLDKIRQLRFVDTGQNITDGPQGSSDALTVDGSRRIDYIFSSNSTSTVALNLCATHVEHFPFLDDQVPEGSLSDHLAVACEFQLVPQCQTNLP